MSSECEKLHKIFSGKKINFPFNDKEIPGNGIYVLFEKGEEAHGTNRIVRIGTHTGKNQLPSRLKQHFLNENKDRSIFRKNIGRALLNKNKDAFLSKWEIDLTTSQAKKDFSEKIDFEKLKKTEKEVSDYIQKNFIFFVFPVEDKEKRLEIESKIISTISLCKECKPSENWLGLFSPKEKIRKSGLWLVNELYKNVVSEKDIEEIENLIKNL
ncbi:hypothetical protein FJZ19_03965 [Candidatus Pacearchaeota archaeon]|nr:hypothetical protein [Candidatus Pacearchaeota archaeon]